MNKICQIVAIAVQQLSGERRLRRSGNTSRPRCQNASFLSFWQQCVPRDHYRLYYLQPYNIKGRGQPAQGDVGAVGEDGEENWVVCWGGRGGGGGQLLGGGGDG